MPRPFADRQMKSFRTAIWSHYREHGRSMPWRDRPTLYNVIVSELMLQQTQVSRVMAKFASFVQKFPDWKPLAKASTREILQEWSGLGYNRRALYLKRIAEQIWSRRLSGKDACSLRQELLSLPGIGPNTASSIMAFAYNIPVPFIETNIRSVFIHFFFPAIEKREGRKACKKVSDDQLMPLIEKALADPENRRNPREWHYALMDYGTHLKKALPNPSRRSAHHVKQSPFKGSNRELRSRILREVMKKPCGADGLCKRLTGYPSDSIVNNLSALAKEGFIGERAGKYTIS